MDETKSDRKDGVWECIFVSIFDFLQCGKHDRMRRDNGQRMTVQIDVFETCL